MTYEEYVLSLESAKYTIYKILCVVTNKPYVGITKQKLSERWSRHIWDATYMVSNGKGNHFQKALVKYGKESFTIEQIDTCLGFSAACELEKKYIYEYDSFESGYNTTLGGQGVPGVCWKDDAVRQSKMKNKKSIYWKSVQPIDRLSEESTKCKQSEAKLNSGKFKLTVMGVEYNSLRQAAVALNSSTYLIKEHLATGKPIKQVTTKKRKAYIVNDLIFDTRYDAAEFFKLSVDNLASTIKRYKQYGILEDVITKLKSDKG